MKTQKTQIKSKIINKKSLYSNLILEEVSSDSLSSNYQNLQDIFNDYIEKLDKSGVEYYIGGSSLSYMVSPKTFKHKPQDLDVYVFNDTQFNIAKSVFGNDYYKNSSPSGKVLTIERRRAFYGDYFPLQIINMYTDKNAFVNFYSISQAMYNPRNNELRYTNDFKISLKNKIVFYKEINNPLFFKKIESYKLKGITITDDTIIKYLTFIASKETHKLEYTSDKEMSKLNRGTIIAKTLNNMGSSGYNLQIVPDILNAIDGIDYSVGFKIYNYNIQEHVLNNATAIYNQYNFWQDCPHKLPQWAKEEIESKYPELIL